MLIRNGGSSLKLNYLADILVGRASLSTTHFSQLFPFSELLCRYLPGVSELSKLLKQSRLHAPESQVSGL